MNDYLRIHPLKNRIPNTWGEDGALNEKILAMMGRKIDFFKEKKGLSWLIGPEQEFVLHEKKQDATLIENKREKFVSEEPDSERKLQLEKFSPAELLMYELHKRCEGILQPAFGEGYYDKRYVISEVMEAGFIPQEPFTSISNFHKFNRVLEDLAYEYGFSISYHKTDKSFSLKDIRSGSNIMDFSQGKNDERARAAAEGVQRITYDAAPCFMRRHRIEEYLKYGNIDTGMERVRTLRVENGRFELRVDHNPQSGEHLALSLLLLMAGAEHGLNQSKLKNGVPNRQGNQYYQGGRVMPMERTFIPVIPEKYKITPLEFVRQKIFQADDPGNEIFFFSDILNGGKRELDDETGGVLIIPNPKHTFIYGGKYKHLQRELEPYDNPAMMRWLKNGIRVNGDGNIDLSDLGLLTPNPDGVKRKLGMISFGKEVTTLHGEGYAVDPDYQRYGTDMMKAHLEFMRGSPGLIAALGREIIEDIASSLAAQYKINLDPRSPASPASYRA